MTDGWRQAHTLRISRYAIRDDFARAPRADAHPRPSRAPLGGPAPGGTRASGHAGRPIGRPDHRSAVLLVVVWAAVNWIVQVVRKPTEVFVPGQRLACQGAGADLAAIRPALRRALHGGHHAGTAGRAGPGGEQRQPGGTDLLAVAIQLEPIRAVPAGLERRRDVSDHRRNVRRSQALLHP